ncbi:AP-2 complex subunit mu [Hibiscus syriacus]|uniref:AP-2 complex subunit mu n=1 Tax=Hibiscus syriacus TaxID=106335 RepID=A0A6A3C4P2_HIBSY|nr:AP-2 complex subunit mu [Hibiscus syriacus]
MEINKGMFSRKQAAPLRKNSFTRNSIAPLPNPQSPWNSHSAGLYYQCNLGNFLHLYDYNLKEASFQLGERWLYGGAFGGRGWMDGDDSRLRHLLLPPPSIHFIQHATRSNGSKMPVAASAIYFLNLRGDVLINRLYRDDVGRNMVDAFRKHIMQTKELGTCPARQIGCCSFFYMRISNAVAMFKSYFGGGFDEYPIRNNFVLIYELLDEIMDFGHPQNLSPEILKHYITQEGCAVPILIQDKPIPKATLQVTGAVGWRREGLVYKKNEVFLDIVESVNLLMSSKGCVLRCDVTGKILMKYRITEGVNLPSRVLPTIKELGRTRMEVNVKCLRKKMFALGVIVKIPMPKQTAKTSFQVTSGRAKYNSGIDCLVRKKVTRKFPGETEPTLSAEVEMISTMTENKSWTKPPIQMEFQVPIFMSSGFLRYGKRVDTKAGSYEVRCQKTWASLSCIEGEYGIDSDYLVLSSGCGVDLIMYPRDLMMGCLVLPASLLRRRSMGYRPLTKEDAYGELDRRVAVR